jgi:hypothetical protein
MKLATLKTSLLYARLKRRTSSRQGGLAQDIVARDGPATSEGSSEELSRFVNSM